MHVWAFRLRGERAATARHSDQTIRVMMMLALIANRRHAQHLQ